MRRKKASKTGRANPARALRSIARDLAYNAIRGGADYVAARERASDLCVEHTDYGVIVSTPEHVACCLWGDIGGGAHSEQSIDDAQETLKALGKRWGMSPRNL